jgi:hypothetical protein
LKDGEPFLEKQDPRLSFAEIHRIEARLPLRDPVPL